MRIYKYIILTLVFCCMSAGGWCDSLDRARKLYIMGDYDNSICELQGSCGGVYNDDELYLLGLNYIKVGDYPQARDYFRRIIKSYKQSSYYEQAMVKIGDAYFLEGTYGKAEDIYASILKKYPSSRFKPLLYLRLAQISAKDGRWQVEKDYIKKIKKDYPRSPEKKYADILEERGYFFTIQVGAFSQKENAEKLAEELKSGFDSYLAKEKIGDLTLYKVRVGKYQKRKPAEHDYRKLIDMGLPARIYP